MPGAIGLSFSPGWCRAPERSPSPENASLEVSSFGFETSPINPLRTLRDHLLSPVIQFGPPRTGSTLVWNAIRAVRPGIEVPKRHDLSFLHRSPFCRARFIATVRDPLDIITSMLGVSEMEPTPDAIDAKLEELARQGMADAIWLRHHPRALILRYEDFYGAFDRLFTPIEAFLEASASTSARQQFEERFAIDSVRKRAEALQSFEQFDVDDQIHGRHISAKSGRPGSYCGILHSGAIQKVRIRFADFIEAFDY